MLITHRARAVWTGEVWLEDAAVVTRGTEVVEVRPGRSQDGPALDGLLCPGLVNAHAHLELTHLAGRVPPAPDFPSWLSSLLAQRADTASADKAATNGAVEAVNQGTAALMDVSNRGDTAGAMAEAGLVGICQHELLGFHRADLADRLALARAEAQLEPRGRVWTRPGPHAPYSTPDALVQASSAPGPAPASIHLAEDPAEVHFLASGEGPFADVLDRLGRDWRWWRAPGLTPVAWLESLGCLGPDLLLVHARHVSDEDVVRIGRSRASVVLCPRSNRHIGGDLPPVAAMVRLGVPLALGTDSLASCPDLDLLGDVAELVRSIPDVPPESWLASATSAGADALRLPTHGRLQPGAQPGVLFLDGIRAPGDLHRVPERRWCVPPGGRLEA